MANMSDYLEAQLRAHVFRTGSFAKPAALYVSLHTADPTDAGTGAEVTGGSYARVARNPGDANWAAGGATDGATDNVADITFPAPTAGWGTVTHFGIWDAAIGGNLLVHAALTTPRTINGGDPAPVFPAGALDVAFA
jgi:hypothetical protein